MVDEAKLNHLLSTLKRIENLGYTKPLEDSAELVKEEIDDNFDKQGAIYQGGGFIRKGGSFANLGRATTRSSSWSPLAASTRRSRIYRGFPAARPILENTSKLRKGFRIAKVTKDRAVIENDVSYGKYHQTGTRYMPQRRLVGFSEKSVKAIGLIFSKHINKVIDR